MWLSASTATRSFTQCAPCSWIISTVLAELSFSCRISSTFGSLHTRGSDRAFCTIPHSSPSAAGQLAVKTPSLSLSPTARLPLLRPLIPPRFSFSGLPRFLMFVSQLVQLSDALWRSILELVALLPPQRWKSRWRTSPITSWTCWRRRKPSCASTLPAISRFLHRPPWITYLRRVRRLMDLAVPRPP